MRATRRGRPCIFGGYIKGTADKAFFQESEKRMNRTLLELLCHFQRQLFRPSQKLGAADIGWPVGRRFGQ